MARYKGSIIVGTQGFIRKWSNEQRAEAEELRRQGFVVSEISKRTGIPKGTLGGWLAGIIPNQSPPATISYGIVEPKKQREPAVSGQGYQDGIKKQMVFAKDSYISFDLSGVIKAIESLVDKVEQLEKENQELRASFEVDKSLWHKLGDLMAKIK